MTTIMMLASAVISIVFLADFSRTILELQRDRAAIKMDRRERGSFPV